MIFKFKSKSKYTIITEICSILKKHRIEQDEYIFGNVYVLFRSDPTTCLGQLFDIQERHLEVTSKNCIYLIIYTHKAPDSWTSTQLIQLQLMYLVSNDVIYLSHMIPLLDTNYAK